MESCRACGATPVVRPLAWAVDEYAVSYSLRLCAECLQWVEFEAKQYFDAVRPARRRQSFVYYVEKDGLVKIGRAVDVESRVRRYYGTLLAVEPETLDVTELDRHEQFGHLRVSTDDLPDGWPWDGRTEWFRADEELMSHIEGLGCVAEPR